MLMEYKPYLTSVDVANILEVDIHLARKYMRDIGNMEYIEEDEKGNKRTVTWKTSDERKWVGRNVVKTDLFVKRFKSAKKCFIMKKGTSEAAN